MQFRFADVYYVTNNTHCIIVWLNPIYFLLISKRSGTTLFFNNKKSNNNSTRPVPTHIAIIMDGNGRWAKKRGLPRSSGHVAGAQTFKTIAKYCNKIGLKYLTVYAFSTENWKRPQDEIQAIMNLFKSYLTDVIADLGKENIKIRFIGDITPLNDNLKTLIKEAEEITSTSTGLNLNIAVNYGGRQEILFSTKKVCEDVLAGKLKVEDISEKTFEQYIFTKNQPDPDLIIRPSGEERLSNFLLWQAAYSEFWYSDVLWPDFKTETLEQAIRDYNKRKRRFGGI